MIPNVHSIKAVEKHYPTGEEPLLVLCSDMNEYVCKYARMNGAAYKMASELIGACLAEEWHLNTPPIAFVKISANHWVRAGQDGTMALGSRRMDSVIDINPVTEENITPSERTAMDLLRIALFDFWIANEDRNSNNANLMYDVGQDSLVSIDYGCIFNTAMYDFPLSQLTSTDTILNSNLFRHFKGSLPPQPLKSLSRYFNQCIKRSRLISHTLIDEIPIQWKVPHQTIKEKLTQLYAPDWIDATWENFMECFDENM